MLDLPMPPSPKFRSTLLGPLSHVSNWWLLWRVPILALIVMGAWWFLFRPIIQEQGWVRVSDRFSLCGAGEGVSGGAGGERQAGCVVDGDTVVLGFGETRRRIRLTEFDTPELAGACAAEQQLAEDARLRLHKWLGEGAFEWDGGVDPPRDQYGRELRSVRRITQDGSREYLAETMIEDGLAADDDWHAEPEDWCD